MRFYFGKVCVKSLHCNQHRLPEVQERNKSQEPENKRDDAKKKEDRRADKAVGAGMGKDFAGSPAPGTEPTPSTLRATVQHMGRGYRTLCDTVSC